MPSKREILDKLNRNELIEITDRFEIDVADRRAKDNLVEGLAKARKVTAEEMLVGLSRDRLKELCRAFGLDDSGREKAAIADRLTDRTTSSETAERLEPAPKKQLPSKRDVRATERTATMAKKSTTGDRGAQDYSHPENTTPLRPEIGTQTAFKKKKPPAVYRFDSSIAPELLWDEGAARESGEALIRQILDAEDLEQAKAAAAQLRAMSRPFLNWSGKAERSEISVPTLPLFIHERLSTKAIIETLAAHKSDKQLDLLGLFADPKHSIRDQVLRAYEHRDKWVNRFVLGDSLVVMNSLLKYEDIGGQVQMIYVDPPYGVKFGSNFQPFVRKRDVSHNDDEDFTREPEMVQAYRDTWELGLHSYLTYLRDRLLLCRELLAPTGSIFVQISDENLHHVRELMDEVLGADNAMVTIVLKKKGVTTVTDPVNDYILWYAKDKERAKSRVQRLAVRRRDPEDDPKFNTLISIKGEQVKAHTLTEEQIGQKLSEGWRWARVNYPIVSQHPSPTRSGPYVFRGKTKSCGRNAQWRFDVPAGLDRLAKADRLFDGGGESLGGIVFWDDWPYVAISNVWNDLKGEENPEYVVQTSWRAIERCVLMTTQPGDLVFDPTCGSGTTAFVAEKWGRRWITCDTSRVPLALARQRLLTASFDYYELQDDKRGPGGGFVYKRRQNAKGEEVGGIVPHITLKSIANEEPPAEEVLVDRSEVVKGIARVTGPFVVEATIPTPVDWEGDGIEDSGSGEDHASHVARMIEVLRLSPMLQLAKGETATLSKVRPPARSLNLSAEAELAGSDGKRVAIVFGPKNGAISETLVFHAAKEANAKGFDQLYVIGFAIQPDARKYIEDCDDVAGITAAYIQATPDLLMGDLLKNMRSSQVFSVCGLPEIAIHKAKKKEDAGKIQVELLGLDVFDPTTMKSEHVAGIALPAWLLDTNYNGSCFHVCQAFFPRTGAWEKIKKALKAEYDESVWEHLAGTVSAPFEPGDTGKIAVKAIDLRGNELMTTSDVPGAKR